jgi:hypothetical protein
MSAMRARRVALTTMCSLAIHHHYLVKESMSSGGTMGETLITAAPQIGTPRCPVPPIQRDGSAEERWAL